MLYILLYCDTIIIKKHPVLNQYNEAWPYGDTSVTIDLFVMVTLNKLINEKDKKMESVSLFIQFKYRSDL